MIRPREDRRFERFRRTGDPRALASVFDRTAPELWKVAAHLCRDRHEAEDLVQGTFLTAIEDQQSWDASRPVLPWLLGILTNRARETRRRAARAIDPARLAAPVGRDPADDAGHAELSTAMREALHRVPSPYRETLEQHLVHGKSPHEIAAEQGLAQGTVRMRVHRGLDHLRRHLPRGFVTAGAVALRVPPESLAAMREVVLAKVPGGTAALAAVGSGHAVLTLTGALMMKSTLLTFATAAVVALAAWLAWPSPDTASNAPDRPAAVPDARRVADQGVAATAADADTDPTPARTTVPSATSPETGQLRVLVRNETTGEGIAGVMVQIRSKRIGYGRTDADGVAAFEVAPGTVSIDLLYLTPGVTRTADVVAGRETELVVDLPARIRVDVEVVDASGRPVPAAHVVGRTATDPGNLTERELGRTGEDGHWRAAFVEGGLSLRAFADGWAATPMHRVDPRGDEVIPIRLELAHPAATLAGSVRSVNGAPITDAGIAIQPESANALHEPPIVANVQEDGSFEVAHVPPGPCTVFAWRVVENGQRRLTRVQAVATAGTRTVVDIRFGHGARVFGTLLRADGSPVADEPVSAAPYASGFWVGLAADASGYAMTGPDGSYAIEGLMPGRYRLQARVADAAITLDAELAEGEDLQWDPSFGATSSIDARVVDHTGRSLAGWTVSVAPEEGVVRNAVTDSNGAARFENVSEGAYRVSAAGSDAPFTSVTREDVAAGTLVVLTVNADALPDAGLRGALGPSEGIDVADLTLRLFRQRTSEQIDVSVDPADGSFAVTNLVPATYDLLIQRGRAQLAFRQDLVVVSGQDLDVGTIPVGEPGGVLFDVVRTDGARATDPFVGARVTGQATPFARVPQKPTREGVAVEDVPPITFDALAWGADIAPTFTSVTTRAGERTIVPVVAQPATPTTVRFTRDDGGPLGGTVTVRSANGTVLVAEMLRGTGFDSYVRGLAPGRYTIEIEVHDGARGSAEFTVGATAGDPVDVALSR